MILIKHLIQDTTLREFHGLKYTELWSFLYTFTTEKFNLNYVKKIARICSKK